MASVDSILQLYTEASGVLMKEADGKLATKSGAQHTFAISREKLMHDLTALKRHTNRFLILCTAMVVAFYIGLIALIIAKLEQSMVVQIATAISGLSASGLIYKLITLLRTKHDTEFMLALAPTINDETLQAVIQATTNKIYPS